MIEDEEVSITDATNVTADTCSHVPSSQRENPNAVFTSEKIEKSDDIFDPVESIKINDAGYDLNIETGSDAQVDLKSNPDTITRTSNGILDQNY